MFGVQLNSHPHPTWVQFQYPVRNCNFRQRVCPFLHSDKAHSSFALSHSTFQQQYTTLHKTHYFSIKASSDGSAEYTEEPATNVAFRTTLSLPGCSDSLTLLGTGFREKVFAIIGVKVYAAALYTNPTIASELGSWKGRSAAEILGNSSLFTSIFQAPLEKSLQIVLVRDVDGKTFWDALDEAISPRIKSPTSADESALSTFRGIFQGRSLRKGTFIFLTWLDQSKMIVSVSSDGIPSKVDATLESGNVTSSLFDVFFGDAPVSPTLKASVANGVATILK